MGPQEIKFSIKNQQQNFTPHHTRYNNTFTKVKIKVPTRSTSFIKLRSNLDLVLAFLSPKQPSPITPAEKNQLNLSKLY